jgi:phosphatidylinositol alpha 1,6-mannosyltransferase
MALADGASFVPAVAGIGSGERATAEAEHAGASAAASVVSPRTGVRGPDAVTATPVPAPGRAWRRYAALGDSITEGLCDTSRTTTGECRGWADRLAMLLAVAAADRDLRYANLAVRSRRVADVIDEQLPHALALGADLVSVLVGGNDLVRAASRPEALATRLATAVRSARAAGCDVLVVTPFMPASPRLAPLRGRFDRFAARLVDELGPDGAMLLDTRGLPGLIADGMWAEDRVHLNSTGHRTLAYAAAGVLGVPDAAALAGLDAALHGEPEGPDAPPLPTGEWLLRHAAPWAARRALGRTAGDGRLPKHLDFVPVGPPRRDRASGSMPLG